MSLGFEPPARFKLLGRLGEGATGVVYEAMDGERGERVALKTLERASSSGRARAQRDFASLRDLRHPNLVRLEELFTESDPWFLTMELVEGLDLVAHVRAGRPAPHVDEHVLRDALAQLAGALTALHDARKIHRDVKPSNVRVASDGRVVLLDFGLVTEAEGDQRVTGPRLAGTIEYMAPEQAATGELGPPADWYAFGCILYEALTGRLPFEGSSVEIMLQKQEREPPPVRRLVPNAPADLDDLAWELLRFDPASRPLGPAVRERLCAVRKASGPLLEADAAPFVGRARELEAVRAAFDASRRGASVTLVLEGDSGVGKTALARRAIASLSAATPLVVLEGLCRERESAAYKALEGISDGLARHLGGLTSDEVEALLPRHAELLARTFPALARVDAVASRSGLARGALDPLDERSRLFTACRELFARLATRRTVVLVVDDLQWADPDSLALLSEILRPPDSPAILLLATTRIVAAEPGARGAAIPGREVRRERIERLPDGEAQELVALLAARVGRAAGVDTAAIVREADGHPLFIDELVRHAASGEGATGALHLDDALWARVQRLDVGPRRLVELIAVAGRPMATHVLARAAEVEPEEAGRWLTLLRTNNLVRATRGERADVAEPYHDRVREAVLAHLAAGEKRALHQRIALALKGEASPDPEALLTHWLEAGDEERAAACAEEAGAAAERALAFGHASRLFRQALDLRVRGGGAPRSLRRRLAEALANAGIGSDAAREYLLAAADAPPAEGFELRLRAAEQFLLAGFLEEGLRTSREIVAAAGLSIPRTPLAAIISYLLGRLFIRLRGLGYVERAEADLPKLQLSVLDLSWSLSFALAPVDAVRGADLQERCLLMSLKLGEPYRVARSLGLDASVAAAMGAPWKAAQTKATRALDVAKRIGSPRAIALATGLAGTTAYLAGHYPLARAQLDEALEMWRDATGAWSEIARARYFVSITLGYLGEVKELETRMPLYMREATERGDRYAITSCRTGIGQQICFLARDDAAGAREDVADAMRMWSKDGFHVPHYQKMIAYGDAYLYEGDVEKARDEVLRAWAPLEGSLLLRVQIIRLQSFSLRARTALAAAVHDTKRRDALLREAARYARRCVSRGGLVGRPTGNLFLASRASLLGDTETALALFEQALAGFDQTKMPIYADVCRYAIGHARGAAGVEAREAASRSMQARGVRAPAKMVQMLVPNLVAGTGA